MKRDEGVVGKVTHVEDHGTIVIMWVKTRRRKRPLMTVNFDHRMFRNMWEQEGGVIEGRKVQVFGTEFADQRVEFLD